MIKEQVIIEKDSYNLNAWKEELIKRCYMDNPSHGEEYIAKLLGISHRNLFRMRRDGKIKIDENARQQLSQKFENKSVTLNKK